MAWFSSKVKVRLIDNATGQVFAETKMPPEDLPESFDEDTTLHLGDVDWSVVEARPAHRAQYAQTKKLTLRLHRIEKIDPSTIRYSLPTICDAIPGLSEQPTTGEELQLEEDDWRQCEFVSGALAADVDGEITAIRGIYEGNAGQVGFGQLHVRSKVEPPLVGDISGDELVARLGDGARSVGLTYRGASTRIDGGFAFRWRGPTVYGLAVDGRVRVLALAWPLEGASADAVHRLRALAEAFQLELVDWCRCARIAPGDPRFEATFAPENAEAGAN
ncbi:MAG: hypothetical protein AAGM22_14110 [Acidobacteriota bacterium]